jgi:hypothetical protein
MLLGWLNFTVQPIIVVELNQPITNKNYKLSHYDVLKIQKNVIQHFISSKSKLHSVATFVFDGNCGVGEFLFMNRVHIKNALALDCHSTHLFKKSK